MRFVPSSTSMHGEVVLLDDRLSYALISLYSQTRSQIGVFLAYANRYGAVLLDRERYLHADWEKDPERCQEAGVPEEPRKTIPKPTLAISNIMKRRVLTAADLPLSHSFHVKTVLYSVVIVTSCIDLLAVHTTIAAVVVRVGVIVTTLTGESNSTFS